MSDSDSPDSQVDCVSPNYLSTEELFDETTPPDTSTLTEDDRPICSKMGEERRFENLLENQLLNTPESKRTPNPTIKTGDKPKRKFLKRGEGTARFSPGAKHIHKPIITKQTSSNEEPMKRITTQAKHKPVSKRIPQIIESSQPSERVYNKGLSPIPFTPPSNTNGTPLNTRAFEFRTPPLSSELCPKHISFQTADYQLTDYPDYSSDLYRVPSDDSVIMGFVRNEREQQEDLKEFEALEALIEAHVNGQTSLDLNFNNPMDSPTFHVLGRKAKEYINRKDSVPDAQIHSPISVANSSIYQNPLDVAIVDDDEWDDYLGDEFVNTEVYQHRDQQQQVMPETFNNLKTDNEKEVRNDARNEVDTIIREKIEELESEISEYQKLNAAMKKQETERKQIQNNYQEKLNEFEEFKKCELERMDKDFQTQMSIVKRERHRLEQYKQAYHSSESKILKQEIEIMREQLNESQDALREKEAKNRSEIQRLKDNIRHIELERDELKEQLNLMQSLRLKQWADTSDQLYTKQTTRATNNHSFNKIELDKQYYDDDDDESTQLLSESSSSVESYSNEQSEFSTVGNMTETSDTKNSTVHSYANSTAIPYVEKLSERILPDNSTEVVYFNNTRKVISPNGKLVTLYLSNGDIKTMTEDRSVYFYAENSTKYTKLKNGREIFEYSSGQKETTYPDGSKEIIFPDGNKAQTFADGSEKVTCKDGTVQKKSADASTTVIWHPSGYVDTITSEFKKREFADGTCKIVFKDGVNETRYPGGRVRIKTAEGKVVHDGIIEK